MTEFLHIATTTGTRDDAQRIATELVDRRLAACVQISGPIQSTYRWQDNVETADEWLCTVKTSRAHWPAVEKLVKEFHPYEVPELVATTISAGSDSYLEWLEEQLGGP
jgi:periplasmic divalent cation tolerance protein